MGMYTELVLKCEVRDNIEDNVRAVLEFLFNDGPEPKETPDHEFFSCDRWQMIGRCSSYYHVPFALSKYSEGHIFSRSDLKNYDNEIEKFISWIRPYLDLGRGSSVIGWSWCEEDESPTFIHANTNRSGAERPAGGDC
ncbi:MAG TPA: hypothetical protein PJ991_13060 [Kiritimatiellia bacterium]|nr:hypothetical protein [Kiritimatiellia bacterium]